MERSEPFPPEARWWVPEPAGDGRTGRVRCLLCPRECRPRPGQAGFCAVRANRDGRLVTLAYGRLASVAVDPIEKKPLYHFLPASEILSVGTVGCTMGCVFCQNWTLSRGRPGGVGDRGQAVPPDALARLAREEGCASVAFTYNEPTVFAEYVVDAARAARDAGVRTVLVTNGYVGAAALDDLYADIDAANVDLKAIAPEFYRRRTASDIGPVLRTLEWVRGRGRTWLEVTNLLIPGWNDAPSAVAELSRWVVDHLGPDTPVHFSAFHPAYRATDLPPTPEATVLRAREQAREAGLRFVYTGNVRVAEGGETRCPGCGRVLVRRQGYAVAVSPDFSGGRCAGCGASIPGVW